MSRRESLRNTPARPEASTSQRTSFVPARGSRLKNELTTTTTTTNKADSEAGRARTVRRRPSKAAVPPSKSSPKRVGAHGQALMPRAVPDTICAFCGGDCTLNKHGRSEDLVACYECGSAGHPTCLAWDDMRLVRKVGSYPWLCQECKRCEVCVDKGDDDDMLLCDSCDRGWHSQCLDPPLEHFPRGKWSCPTCRAESNFFQVAALPKKRAVLAPPSPQAPRNPPSTSTHHATRSQPRPGTSVQFGTPTPAAITTAAQTPGSAPLPFPYKRPRGRPRKDGLPPRPRQQPFVEIDHTSDPDFHLPRVKLPGFKLTLKMPAANGRSGSATPVTHKKREPEPWEWVRNAHLYDDDLLDNSSSVVVDNDDDDDDDDPYGGALTARQADPGDRKPAKPDRDAFDTALRKAEEKMLAQYRDSRSASPAVAGSSSSTGGTSQLPIGQIRRLLFGEYSINTWYQAPFPEEFARVPDGTLWVCEFCLKYMRESQGARHRLKCKTRHPPGDEIYRDGKLSVWEIDGRKNKMYCQNLCLLAKQFLDHKTLYYDVEPFLFYILTTADVTGAKFIGYFSKEKRSPTNNVSCIMTLPVRQRQGWGQWLIDFSYLLSKKEGRAGTPERPLSGLGAISYDAYWKLTVFRYLLSLDDNDEASKHVKIEDISTATSMMEADIMHVLRTNDMIVDLSLSPSTSTPVPQADGQMDEPAGTTAQRPQPQRRGNSWTTRKRINIGSYARVEGSSSSQPHRSSPSNNNDGHATLKVPARYEIRWDKATVEAHVRKWDEKGYAAVNPDRLQWSPFLVTRMHGLETQVGSTGIDPASSGPDGTQPTSVGAKQSSPPHVDRQQHYVNGNEAAPSEAGSTSTTALINGHLATASNGKQPQHRKRKLIDEDDENVIDEAADDEFVPDEDVNHVPETEADEDDFDSSPRKRQRPLHKNLPQSSTAAPTKSARPTRRSAARGGSLNEAALVQAAFADIDDDLDSPASAPSPADEDGEETDEDQVVADALVANGSVRRSSPRRRQ